MSAWFGDIPPLCPCSQQLLDSLGSQADLQQLMSAAGPDFVSSSGSMVTQLPQQGMRAVRAGSSFGTWAAVDANGRCCSCDGSNYRCSHAQLVSPGGAAAASGPAAADWPAFDAKVRRHIDPTSGQWISKRVSQCQLPEDLRDDPALLSIDTGEHLRPSGSCINTSTAMACWSSS